MNDQTVNILTYVLIFMLVILAILTIIFIILKVKENKKDKPKGTIQDKKKNNRQWRSYWDDRYRYRKDRKR